MSVELHPDPIQQFQDWHAAIIATGQYAEPTAMTLATVGVDHTPDARIVLLKKVDDSGFYFVTNYQSSKGRAIAANPRVAAVFYWDGSEQQVRIRGHAETADRAFSEAYFASRSRKSQLGAWASAQSTVLDDPMMLHQRVADADKRFSDIPCPDHWGGYRIVPNEIEFWIGQPHRLHDRFLYTKQGDRWVITRLNP